MTISSREKKLNVLIADLLAVYTGISLCIIIIGATIFISQNGNLHPHFNTFRGEPADLRSCSAIIRDFNWNNSKEIMQFGLFVLIGAPIFRIALTAPVFAAEKDWKYVIISSILLAILLYSLLSSAG